MTFKDGILILFPLCKLSLENFALVLSERYFGLGFKMLCICFRKNCFLRSKTHNAQCSRWQSWHCLGQPRFLRFIWDLLIDLVVQMARDFEVLAMWWMPIITFSIVTATSILIVEAWRVIFLSSRKVPPLFGVFSHSRIIPWSWVSRSLSFALSFLCRVVLKRNTSCL